MRYIHELDVDDDTFGGRLYHTIIKECGSRNAFITRTGISRDTLLNYIHNKRSPNIAILVCICKELDVSADYLLFGEEGRKNGKR